MYALCVEWLQEASQVRDQGLPLCYAAFLEDVGKYGTMRSLWMSSCEVILGACKTLAEKMPRLKVELISDRDQMEFTLDDDQKVEKMYLYRSVAGHREDAPEFVWILQLLHGSCHFFSAYSSSCTLFGQLTFMDS
ncbi:f-box family protein [Corchorus olitorius]|uniref:F-box family protein n=1 Tax=Corchorus olitorius TaxID=93759 RepID=A0A1R3H1T5_9ROSI|nr:f-box family protein [Corchorus olitorius]